MCARVDRSGGVGGKKGERGLLQIYFKISFYKISKFFLPPLPKPSKFLKFIFILLISN
jgi:hypothetical protein